MNKIAAQIRGIKETLRARDDRGKLTKAKNDAIRELIEIQRNLRRCVATERVKIVGVDPLTAAPRICWPDTP